MRTEYNKRRRILSGSPQDYMPLRMAERKERNANLPQAERRYTVSEVARDLEVSNATLYRWEKLGRLLPSERNPVSGLRLYSYDDIEKGRLLVEYSAPGSRAPEQEAELNRRLVELAASQAKRKEAYKAEQATKLPPARH